KTGAAMTYFPGGEIYTALAMNTVDGATWTSYSGNYLMSFHEVAKYFLPMVRKGLGSHILTNLDAYNSLPEDLKLMVEYYFTMAGIMDVNVEMINDGMAKDDMIQNWGLTILELPAEDMNTWAALGEEMWDEIAKENDRALEWTTLLKEWVKWRGYL
ncbi:hypothetical protein ACFLWZ_08905, partial [Chloroflexota bacterium]